MDSVLEGVAGKWRDVGEELYVPGTTMDVIASESVSDILAPMGPIPLLEEAHMET